MNTTQDKQIESKSNAATVYVVDGDLGVLHSVRSLLGTLGVGVKCYRSAEKFLEDVDSTEAGCVITEVHLPGISGVDLLKALRTRGVRYPVIVMASDADIPIAVRAMALGAMDFIEKPFVDQVLITRVRQALHTDS